jgi:hypothetical protein
LECHEPNARSQIAVAYHYEPGSAQRLEAIAKGHAARANLGALVIGDDAIQIHGRARPDDGDIARDYAKAVSVRFRGISISSGPGNDAWQIFRRRDVEDSSDAPLAADLGLCWTGALLKYGIAVTPHARPN